MEQANQAQDAEELLRRYPEWLKQSKTLKRLIEQADEFDDDALIEQYALKRGQPDGLPFGKGAGTSKTEGLALKLDELRAGELLEREAALRKWTRDLRILEMKMSLYEAATQALTSEEKFFVGLHIQKGYSLRRLAAGTVPPAERIPGSPSLYSLGQMKRRILRNVEMVLTP